MGRTGLEAAEGGGRHERGGQRSTEDEKVYVGGVCVRVPEVLQGGGSRLGLASITSVMAKPGFLSWRRGVCPRLI